RVSAIAASSTTSTERCGRPLSQACSSSRWSVAEGMPVSSWSFSAATPDGAGDSDDADDAVWAGGGLAHHPLLLGGEDDAVGSLDLLELPLADGRRVG